MSGSGLIGQFLLHNAGHKPVYMSSSATVRHSNSNKISWTAVNSLLYIMYDIRLSALNFLRGQLHSF